MSKKDLDEAIFHFKRPEKPGFKAGPPQFCAGVIPEEEVGLAQCYDIHGKITTDETGCAAKQVANKRGTRHFVKWCLDGPDKGHLLNPYSIYYREGDDKKLEQRRGSPRYQFRQVSEICFQHYLNFLSSRMYKYCQEAEREILNG